MIWIAEYDHWQHKNHGAIPVYKKTTKNANTKPGESQSEADLVPFASNSLPQLYKWDHYEKKLKNNLHARN